MTMKRSMGAIPKCQTEEGCPIEDIAADSVIWRESLRFIQARTIKQINGINDFLVDFYRDHGFYESPAEAIELETSFAHWYKQKVKQ